MVFKNVSHSSSSELCLLLIGHLQSYLHHRLLDMWAQQYHYSPLISVQMHKIRLFASDWPCNRCVIRASQHYEYKLPLETKALAAMSLIIWHFLYSNSLTCMISMIIQHIYMDKCSNSPTLSDWDRKSSSPELTLGYTESSHNLWETKWCLWNELVMTFQTNWQTFVNMEENPSKKSKALVLNKWR